MDKNIYIFRMEHLNASKFGSYLEQARRYKMILKKNFFTKIVSPLGPILIFLAKNVVWVYGMENIDYNPKHIVKELGARKESVHLFVTVHNKIPSQVYDAFKIEVQSSWPTPTMQFHQIPRHTLV